MSRSHVLSQEVLEGAKKIAVKDDFQNPNLIENLLGVVTDLTGLDLFSLWEGVEGLVDGVAHVVNQIVDIITGVIVTPINLAVAAVQDFFADLFNFRDDVPVQISNLQNRAQELEGVIGYGNVVQTRNEWVDASQSRPILKFGAQVGRMKGVSVTPAADGLVLGSPGLWRADALVYADTTLYTGSDWITADLEVHYPASEGGGLYERKTIRASSGNGTSLVGNVSFTTPRPGFQVFVFVSSGRWRRFLGGSQWSMLSVNKWDTQVVASPPATVPDGPQDTPQQ